MIKKTIATIAITLLSFSALAEDQKEFFEEWLGSISGIYTPDADLTNEESKELCKKILKHEVDSPVFGNFYTKNGVAKFDDKAPKTKAFLETDKKCDIVKQTRRYLSVFTVYDLNDKYIVYGYKYYTRFSAPMIFFVNKNTCELKKANSNGAGYRDSLFSYAIYNNELYGINRPITVKYNADIGDFQLIEKYPPTIINLDTNKRIIKYFNK